jgi:1-acyl-sn-glycerol-3-phosphate acyltransferase
MTRVRSQMAGNSRASLAFYTFVHFFVVRVFAGLWNRTTVEGTENIPAEGAYILAPVHRSNMDTPYAAATSRRRLRFMGKDSLWKAKLPGWVLSALGGFPVSRGTIDREALSRCTEVLEGGEPLVVFPEGERKSGPVVQPLFEGAAYLAARAGVPIVPVGIGGSERAMPKGAHFIRPTKVAIVIGEPLRVDGAGDAGKRVPREAIRELTLQLHEELQRLFDIAQIRAG